MKRRVVKVCLLLTLGAIANVAVAWGCSLWCNVTGPKCLHIGTDALHGIGFSVQGEYARKTTWGPCGSRTWIHFWPERINAGWPWSCAWAAANEQEYFGERFYQQHIVIASSTLNGIEPDTLPKWLHPKEARGLPVQPLWTGLIANTTFYAGRVLPMMLIAGRMRRRRCIRRRICPSCGYDLRGRPSHTCVCSECGEAS